MIEKTNLYETCDQCQGTGVVPGSIRKHKEPPNPNAPDKYFEAFQCGKCRSLGVLFTGEGQAILKFFKKALTEGWLEPEFTTLLNRKERQT